MDRNKNNRFSNEFVIDIKELCWRLLEQWKAVLIVALFIMALFLGFMHMRYAKIANRADNSQDETQKITAQEIIDSLPEDEQSVVAGAYSLLKERDLFSDYIHNAPLMQIDPNHARRLRVSWGFDKNEEESESLAMNYVVSLQTEHSRSRLIQASGLEMDEGQFNDLVLFKFPDETGNDVVCMDVFLTDDMQSEVIQKELNELVRDVHLRLQEEFGEHQLKNYQSEVATVSDDRVYQKQINLLNNFASYNNQIINLKNNSFTSGQKDAFEKLQKLDNSPEVGEETSTAPKALTIRNIIIGLMLGIILYVLLYFLFIALSNRVLNADALKDSSVRTLGEWHDSRSRSVIERMFRDGLIWKRHHRSHLDRESEKDRITDSITSLCHYKAIDTLLFMATADQTENQREFIQEIIDQLGTQGIYAKLVGSYRDTVFDDNTLMNADGVTVVIVDSKTQLRNLGPVFERCNDFDKPIIGSIYLG